MGNLGHLEHPLIIKDAPHQQRVLRYLPEVCEQAVDALLAQLLGELLGVWCSATCRNATFLLTSERNSSQRSNNHMLCNDILMAAMPVLPVLA